jgi:SulP family sulfate permease
MVSARCSMARVNSALNPYGVTKDNQRDRFLSPTRGRFWFTRGILAMDMTHQPPLDFPPMPLGNTNSIQNPNPRFGESVYAGTVLALVILVASLSFGSLIFSGDLAFGVADGLGIALLSACIIGCIVALRSSYPATIAPPQDRTAPILALIATEVALAMPPGATPLAKLTNVLAAIALTSILTGAALYLLGRHQLGNLTRFIPYPVVGGFLCGSGLLLVKGSLRVMTDQKPTLSSLPRFLDPNLLKLWVPGVLLGLGIFVANRIYRRVKLLPWLLLGSALLFHLVAALNHLSPGQARAAGWLVPMPTATHLLPALWNPSTWNLLDPHAISQAAGLAATAAITSIISILLNASALEITVQQDVDLNQELRAAGIANLAAGCAGGMLGFQSLTFSKLAYDLGARTRTSGIIAASLCGLALLAGPQTLSLVPKFVLGSILFNQGLNFLVEWLYDSRSKLSRSDYGVVVLIVAVMATFGYLEGVGLGLLAAVFLFIHNYSRVGVITHVLTGTDIQSNVERPPAHERLLKSHGGGLHVLKLQGFIFFGTANSLLHNIRSRATNPLSPQLKSVFLDFRRVSGLDSSAAMSLAKIGRLAHRMGFQLALTQVSAPIQRQILRGLPTHSESSMPKVFQDLDHALEWWESQVLQECRPNESAAPTLANHQLWEDWPNPASLPTFLESLQRLELPQGQTLIRQGDSASAMFFIETGEVSTLLESTDGRTPIRLRRQGPGTVLGELGMLLRTPRSASVITDIPVSYFLLTEAALQTLKSTHPAIAADFFEFLSRLLAERVIHTNTTVRTLRD